MKALWLVPTLALVHASLSAQTPTAASHTFTNEIGFSYNLPSDWEFVDMRSSLSARQQQAKQAATDEEQKRGAGCLQIALTAHHGSPGSMVAAVVLPSDCVGKEMSEADLPGFGMGATQGIRQGFDVGDPAVAEYTLGTHKMWSSRAIGNPTGHPELKYTVETVCSLVKKGAVCWMALAADDAGLAVFEQGIVTLDSEAPAALVPAGTFASKPK
jgi:hypothetical protein